MKTIFGNIAPLPENDEKVHPMDLVMQLGRVRRFNGSANPEWTVLHHSMLAGLVWLKTYGAEGVEHALLHDCHEYVTGDIPSPVKAAIGKEPIERLQNHLDECIYDRFEHILPDETDRRYVKVVDWACLFIEAHYIGLPGHVAHIIDTSISRMDPLMRKDVWRVIDAMFPEVAKEMKDGGFFNAPYVNPTTASCA